MAVPEKRIKLAHQLTLSHSQLLQLSMDEKSRPHFLSKSSVLQRLDSCISCESDVTVENEILELPVKRGREESQTFEIEAKYAESDGESVVDEEEEIFTPTGILLINDPGNLFYSLQTFSRSSSYFILLRWGSCGSLGRKAIKGPYHSLARLNLEIQGLTTEKLDSGYVDTRYKGWWKGPVHTRGMDRKVQSLVSLLTSPQLRENTLKELGYARNSKLLASITDQDIFKAYEVLQEIESAILRNNNQEIRSLTQEFYSLIPHKEPYDQDGDTQIDHCGKLRTQTSLLRTLHSLKLRTSQKEMREKIRRLDSGSKVYEELKSSFESTQEGGLMYRAEVEEIFEVGTDVSMQTETALWYGAKTCHWGSILTSGLNIYPHTPETACPSGIGAYLFDTTARAVVNCAPTRKNSIGFIGLCSVQNPETPHTGRFQPSNYRQIQGLQVPIGPLLCTAASTSPLLFTEYVLPPASVQVKYLFQVRFIFA